jgi:hypothetical protein
MPTPTYTPLATVTLGSAATTLTFSNIPTTPYRDLILVTNTLNSTSSENFKIRFNGDTGSNYSMIAMRGDGSSATSTNFTGTWVLLDWVAFGNASNRQNHIVQIMDYSATDKQKTLLSRANVAAVGVDGIAARWANTAAITSFSLFYENANIVSGSRFDLYGIVA